MKHSEVTLLFSLLLLSFSSLAQTEATTKDGRKVMLYKNGTWKYVKSNSSVKSVNVDLKQEALEFSKQLVRSYFLRDCSLIQQSLSPEVFTFKSAVTITEEARNKLCESVKRAVTDSTKSFDDYLASYKMEFFSKSELEAKFKVTLPSHYDSSNEEFYFIGFELKPEVKIYKFVSERLFALLIRKNQGKWEVKGFLED